MKTEQEIRKLLEVLEEADKLYERRYPDIVKVEVCVDCCKIISDEDDCWRRHRTIVTNIDHDGVGEWIRTLKWVLGEDFD